MLPTTQLGRPTVRALATPKTMQVKKSNDLLVKPSFPTKSSDMLETSSLVDKLLTPKVTQSTELIDVLGALIMVVRDKHLMSKGHNLTLKIYMALSLLTLIFLLQIKHKTQVKSFKVES